MDNDHLSNEIGLTVSLNEGGLGAKAKSRAVASIDRLLGALIDLPTAKLEARAQRIRAAAKRDLQRLSSGELVDVTPIERSLSENDLVISHVQEGHVRRIENKKAVVEAAIEHLGGISEVPDEDTGGDEIDPDWLNFFEAYAEKATSERMRDLWGRVLADKIRTPREYSLSTLRFLSELDSDIAKLFERYAAYQAFPDLMVKPKSLTGDALLEITFLEEVGLLQDATGPLGMDVQADKQIVLPIGKLVVVLGAGSNPSRLDLIKITRTAKEILKIMAPISDMMRAERIAETVLDSFQSVQVGVITGRPSSSQVTYQVIRTIKGTEAKPDRDPTEE